LGTIQKKKRTEEENLFLVVAENAFVTQLWPENITHLFVDGNNLFYLTAGLRMLSIQRSRRETERVLAEITETFISTQNLETVLIFDNSSLKTKKTLPNQSTFEVTSAKPNFGTSDEALVHWAKNNPNIAPRTLFITSDKALGGELALTGAKVARSGVWMGYVKRTLTGEDGDYCGWVDAWVERFLQKSR